jgi:hypothetical protein
MKRDRDFDEMAAEWLEAGSDATPQSVIDAVILAIRTTPQERGLRVPWRTLFMRQPAYTVAAAALLAVVGVGAFYAFGRGPNFGLGVTSSPTTSERQTPTPTASPIDTTGWTNVESSRYGFTIGYPPSWTYEPADHDWTLAQDGDNWLSTGQDVFRAPDRAIRVSAWAFPAHDAATLHPLDDLEAWATAYCESAGLSTPCTGIPGRAVPLCIERRDCHPGLLVPFDHEVQAFLTGGIFGDNLVVVAIWRAETEPAVLPYGGARRLLEAFLSTMGVWPRTDFPAGLENGTDDTVVIYVMADTGGEIQVANLAAGTGTEFGSATECSSDELVARTLDGAEVTRRAPPFCPGDTWVIGGT